VSHRNARLTFHGRRLLVRRVRSEGMPVAHVARAMGISRQCAHRRVARFDVEGEAGPVDRSSRPHRMPTRTAAEVEARVIAARVEQRRRAPSVHEPAHVRSQVHLPTTRRARTRPVGCARQAVEASIISNSRSSPITVNRGRSFGATVLGQARHSRCRSTSTEHLRLWSRQGALLATSVQMDWYR
jgi:transposase-like protein